MAQWFCFYNVATRKDISFGTAPLSARELTEKGCAQQPVAGDPPNLHTTIWDPVTLTMIPRLPSTDESKRSTLTGRNPDTWTAGERLDAKTLLDKVRF